MNEDIWSGRLKCVLIVILIILSCCRDITVIFCGYKYLTKEGKLLVTYLDDECTVVDKSESAGIYFLFAIISIVLTVLTSHQLYKIQKDVDTNTKKLIMKRQKAMFIIVSVCTITHLVKAIHQFCWVFAAYFHLNDVNASFQATYIYTHYLSTYSASVTLVIFSPEVRVLLLCRGDPEERKSVATSVI